MFALHNEHLSDCYCWCFCVVGKSAFVSFESVAIEVRILLYDFMNAPGIARGMSQLLTTFNDIYISNLMVRKTYAHSKNHQIYINGLLHRIWHCLLARMPADYPPLSVEEPPFDF